MYSVAILIYETRVLSHFVRVDYNYNMSAEGDHRTRKKSRAVVRDNKSFFAGQVSFQSDLPKG